MPPRIGNDSSLLISATLVAVAAGGIVYHNATAGHKKRKKRRKKKGIFKEALKTSKKFSHQEVVAQFPETEAEIDSLFSRDLPRLEGLKKDDVYSLIASLTSVVNDMQYEHSLQKNNIKRLVLGCCTQAVLAQVLNFLLVEERTYVKEKRPDLMKREDSGFSLFGVRLFGDQHASKAGARISDKDDTLLLHSFLQARINNDDFSILYNLEWNVVSTERPEETIGRWNAAFKVSFQVIPEEIAIMAEVTAVREEYV